jgi:hypothetical protein
MNPLSNQSIGSSISIGKATSEINRLHLLATSSANSAIEYAKEAGKLLLEVKKSMPHGEFGVWIENNLSVSIRQVQRYIATAQGKKATVKSIVTKNDIASHLDDYDVKYEICHNPKWIPEAGFWYVGFWDNAVFHVLPDLNNLALFHISKFHTVNGLKPTEDDSTDEDDNNWDGNSLYSDTKNSISPKRVALSLYNFGSLEPHKLEWKMRKHDGFERPFGEPEDDATIHG